MKDNEINKRAVKSLVSTPGSYALQSRCPSEKAWTMEVDGSPGRALTRLSTYI